MKYENFNQAKEVVEQIQKYQHKYNSLEKNPIVIITHKDDRIYTIGTENISENKYQSLALLLIEKIKDDLRDEIKILKEKLSIL